MEEIESPIWHTYERPCEPGNCDEGVKSLREGLV